MVPMDTNTAHKKGSALSTKRRTITVTLPDGHIATRSTKAAYTHAVIVSPEIPAKVKERTAEAVTQTLQTIADLQEALAADQLNIRGNNRAQDRDPDLGWDGLPSYTGFVYTAFSNDGERQLSSQHGNSRQEARGYYESDGSYHGGIIVDVQTALRHLLELSLKECRGRLRKDQDTIKSVEEGAFDAGPWTAHAFSSSENLARKVVLRDQARYPTRTLRVVPVNR